MILELKISIVTFYRTHANKMSFVILVKYAVFILHLRYIIFKYKKMSFFLWQTKQESVFRKFKPSDYDFYLDIIQQIPNTSSTRACACRFWLFIFGDLQCRS